MNQNEIENVKHGEPLDIQPISDFLVKRMLGQAGNCIVWLNQYQINKDASAIRNANFAIGKVSGIFGCLLVLYGDQDVPKEAFDLNMKLAGYYDSIQHGESLRDFPEFIEQYKVRPINQQG